MKNDRLHGESGKGGRRRVPGQEPAALDLPPWRPASLGELFDPGFAERHAYVVVDEIVGAGVGLSVAPWPGIDKHGRLRFADAEKQRLVGVDRGAFEELLRRNRLVLVLRFAGQLDEPEADRLRERPVRIGDAFAAPVALLGVDENEEDVIGAAGLSEAPIFDITVEARERAKIAMAAALAPVVSEERARRALGDENVEEPLAEDEASEAVAATPDGVILASELAKRWAE